MKLTVLGLDPGTIRMGYSILTVESNHIKCLQYSTLYSPAQSSTAQKLHSIGTQLEKVFQQHQPHHLAIEKMFFGKNPDSAFKLGHAFGIGLYQAYQWNCDIFEYSPRTIKKSVTGTGSASKESVQSFVCNILKIQTTEIDTSDAVAVALCHIYQYQNKDVFKRRSS